MSDFETSLACRSPHAVFRMVEGEAVVVEPQKGLVNILNGVGSQIWEALDGATPMGAIADRIVEAFDVDRATALRDLEDLIRDLAAKELVSLVSNDRA